MNHGYARCSTNESKQDIDRQVRELCGVALGLAGVEYAQPAADLLAFALALPMGLSVLKTFRSDAPTPAHTLREE